MPEMTWSEYKKVLDGLAPGLLSAAVSSPDAPIIATALKEAAASGHWMGRKAARGVIFNAGTKKHPRFYGNIDTFRAEAREVNDTIAWLEAWQ